DSGGKGTDSQTERIHYKGDYALGREGDGDEKPIVWRINMKNKEIVTKRLILRKFQKEDQSFFYELLKDEAVNKFLPWFPVKSMEETKQFLKERYLTVYEK